MQSCRTKKIGVALLIAVSLLASSCGTQPSSQDVLTVKKAEEGRTPITISTKYSVYLDDFERAVEEKFTNVDLIQVGNYTSNYSDEFAQQMANDDLTDIILTWPLNKAAQECEDKLIDLSGMSVTSRYNTLMLNNISQNGKLYYLPGPTQVRGILFNKTMFDEHGWSIPNNFEEFINLCKEIEASGVRSLQLSFWNKEVLRYAFMGFGYGQSFSSPQSGELVQKYRDGEGSLRDFALPAFEAYERMIAEGILKPEDLEIRYPIREQMLFNRQCAMVSDGISLIPLAKKAGNMTDEFQVMPFFCLGDANSWGQLIPNQYIGLNKNLEKPENKGKYDVALQIMDFISTPEGQYALSNGNTTMVSSLVGSSLPNAPELMPMQKTIELGRSAVFPTITYGEDVMYEALAGMLRGEMTRDEAIVMIDWENGNFSPPKELPEIGTAVETFSLVETGNYVTDVMRAQADTDFALFLDNGKDGAFNARGISAKLYKGAIRQSDIELRVLPVLQHGEKGYLNIATISGENLLNALEHTLGDGNWFYYFSGLKMTYDPTAKPGSRVKSVTDEKGNDIEPGKAYTVAIMEDSVAEEYITSIETTETLIMDLLIKDIEEKGSISPSEDGRLHFK